MKDLKTIIVPFQKAPNELLQTLCKYMTTPMLEIIAKADYGNNAKKYLKELQQIKAPSNYS